MLSLYSAVFYIYLFLISAPIFVNIGPDGIKFANYLLGTRYGFTVNIGILLLPLLAALLVLRLLNMGKLKLGYFGRVILLYSLVCVLVMLYGQLVEVKMTRLFLLGQAAVPFISYFYLINFLEYIKLTAVRRILIISLFLQFFLIISLNLSQQRFNFFTSLPCFNIYGKMFCLYGAFDYYPILFLTLVIFFHETVNQVKHALKRNALLLLTILLYAFGLMFHSRNSVIALIFVFAFYLFNGWKKRSFFFFFSWSVFIIITALMLYPNIWVKNASLTRLLGSINYAGSYLGGNARALDASAAIRVEAQLYTFEAIRANPLTGVAFEYPFAAHNQYLSVLGISGVVAFLIFILLIWKIYKRLMGDFNLYEKKRSGVPMVRAMCGIFILFAVSSLFQNNFTVTYTSCIFWVLMGVYELSVRMSREKEPGLG